MNDNRIWTLVAAMGIAAFAVTPAHADQVQWNGAVSGHWTAPSNWVDGAVPAVGDDVLVTDTVSQTNTTVIYGDPGSPVPTLNSLLIDGSPSSDMALEQSAYTLSTQILTVGDSGTATYNMTGGSLEVLENDVNVSTFTLGNLTNSVGTFNQSGGDVTVSRNITLGLDGGSQGAYNLNTGSNPTLTVNGFITLGFDGNGTFNQQADTTSTVNGDIYIGAVNGSYNMTGGDLSVTGGTFVGTAGTGTFAQSAGTHTTTNLSIGEGAGSIGSYQFNGGTLSSDSMVVGKAGTGTFDHNGGDVTISNSLELGVESGSQGTYNLNTGTNPSLTVDGYITVGVDGSGTFNQQADTTNNVGDLYIAGNNGNYYLYGGDLNVTNGTYLGTFGTGNFNQFGGHHTATHLSLGEGATGGGNYSIGGGTLTTGSTTVGKDGSGAFNISGGLHDTGDLTLGSTGSTAGNSVGVYNMIGVGELKANAVNVGLFGLGEFYQRQDSVATIATNLQVGVGPEQPAGPTNLPFREGIYKLEGGTLSVGGNTVIGVGNSFFSAEPGGKGTFIQTAGSHTVTNGLIVGGAGSIGGGRGSYTLDGASSTLTTGVTRIGNGDALAGGTGTFEQKNGTHTTDGLYIGSGTGTGSYSLTGGTLDVTGPSNGVTYVGEGGTAQFTQSGGQFETNFLNVGILNGTNGTFDHSNGSVQVNYNLGIGGAGTGTFNQSGGNVQVNGTVYVGNNAFPTYNGTLNVSGGSFAATGGVLVETAGILKGTGTLTGPVTVTGGTVAPGQSPGLLTFDDSLTLNSGVFSFEIGGTARGTEYDAIDGTNIALNGGALHVDLVDLGSGIFTPQLGDTFNLMVASVLLGDFTSFFLDSPGAGLAWTHSIVDVTGGKAYQLAVISAPVPLPPALLAMASGLGSLVMWQGGFRRRALRA